MPPAIALQLEFAQARQANRVKELRLDEKVNEVEREAQATRFGVECDRTGHTAELASVGDEIDRRRIETANLTNPRLALVKKLPEALGSLAVSEHNLGDDALARLAAVARDLRGKEALT